MQMLIAAFFVLLVLIAVGDLKERKIKNEYLLVIVLLSVIAAALHSEPSAGSRLFGAACISIPLLLLTAAVPGAFGGGDIKLMAVCGLFVGMRGIACAFAAGVMLAGAYAGILLIWGKADRKTRFPLGPFLCIGIAASTIYQHWI